MRSSRVVGKVTVFKRVGGQICQGRCGLNEITRTCLNPESLIVSTKNKNGLEAVKN